MDILLMLISSLMILLGILGAFLPALPGPLTSWLGFFILSFTSIESISSKFLTITFLIALAIFLIDYLIPIWGTKKYGGSKYGVWGSILGIFVGIFFFPPLGIIVGPFVGAFIGEIIYSKNHEQALRSAIGSFIGFILGTGLKFIVAIVYSFLFIQKIYEHYI